MAIAGWSKLQQVHVMPEVGGPWPASWIVTFKNWIDTGLPAGDDPSPALAPIADNDLQAFIALSKALTGLDSFFRFNIFKPELIKQQEEALATIYYNRLLNWAPVDSTQNPNLNLAAVLTAWAASPDTDSIAAQFPICQDIILIWYNTNTRWDGFGSPQFNQYKEGQVWKVSLIHPIGYAPENTPFYWQNAPTDDGQNSGFYYVNY
jgi:hypothetical protein